MLLSRRSFLALLAFARPAVARALGRGAGAEEDLSRLRQLFSDPPAAARPMTRWWWFGGAVTPEEITRELTFMREAGLGGAEIQPVYPVAVDDPARGVRHLRYHTQEWFELLRHAVREARRLGLQLDFTLGSGWPYGGPFVPTRLAARRLRALWQDLAGPRRFSWLLSPHLTGDERVVAVVAAPVGRGQEPDLARSRVLADQPRKETPGSRDELWIRDWPVPEGEWRVLVVIDSPTGQQVKRPTLGMEGSVLDHHSREAMQLFLRAAGDRVMEALRETAEPPFRSVFCDSLEVYGADWTPDLLAGFRARRGYDLAPLLPALWQEAGPKTPHVRHDYHLTLSELMLENFFRPLAEWSERRGMKARIQAHGALADVMQAYGIAHIPEGENIFFGDRYMVNLRHRRLASSAAHLYGRRLVSSETYTWLRLPLFLGTLEMMKAATDSVFLDGLNHVVNHGYSYSPPAAGEPGWHFYAATEINHTNTWWRHYPHLARYVQRAQALLQHGEPVNPVAVYLPLSDIYARHGAGGIHIDVEAEKAIDPELLSGLRARGYDFDIVHDDALARLARVEGGRLRAGFGAYSVVIVPGARFMPPESARRLAELAVEGGHVIFVERLPEGAAGLADQEARSADVRGSLEGLWGGRTPAAGEVAAAGRGSAALVRGRAAAFERLASVLGTDFRIVQAGDGSAEALQAAVENVGFLHRRAGGSDYYLVANISALERDLRVRFAAGHRAPERWNAETGGRFPVAYEYVVEAGRKLTAVELRLDPFESCFVVFGPKAEAPLVTHTPFSRPFELTRTGRRTVITGRVPGDGTYAIMLGSGRASRFAVDGLPPAVSIDGPWKLRLGSGPSLSLPWLRSWTELPEGASFSGWATYETEFDLPGLGEEIEWEIELGQVHETAEVWLNDRPLGAAWRRPRRLACGPAVSAGRNRLKVEVANLWIHHVAAQPPPPEWKDVDETVGIRWGRYGEGKPDQMPPAGLLGPVRLVPMKRVTVTIE